MSFNEDKVKRFSVEFSGSFDLGFCDLDFFLLLIFVLRFDFVDFVGELFWESRFWDWLWVVEFVLELEMELVIDLVVELEVDWLIELEIEVEVDLVVELGIEIEVDLVIELGIDIEVDLVIELEIGVG